MLILPKAISRLSLVFLAAAALFTLSNGCQFYPVGEYLRFVRVPESVPVGGEVLQIELHPRRNLSLQPVDRVEDAQFFMVRDVDEKTVSVILAQSLEDLVDSPSPQNVLKFRLVCDYDDGEDTISSYLSVTVYVEDVNDHSPRFVKAPYAVSVDELTPPGLTLFKGIHAIDRDKPNTPNSDVHYSIVSGDDLGKFSLESANKAALVLRKPLDYETGDTRFLLTIMAADRGSPPRNSTTTIAVTVLDNDDQNPVFTQDIYRARITEFFPITGQRVHFEIKFDPPISAYDEDVGIDAPVHYDLIAGNERGVFSVDPRNGSLFLEREIDLDEEPSLPGNTFVLQIQATQKDNPLKTAVARVEVEVVDINDNMPEFEVAAYNISIVENLPNGFSVLQVFAADKDQGDNGEFSYKLEDSSKAFSMDPRTGWLTVRDQVRLDREEHPSMRMKVYAKEKVENESPGPEASVLVEVTLLDANDNNPTFVPSNLYEFAVHSDASVGEVVGQVKAIDPDLGRNGMVLYALQKSGNASNAQASPFTVDAQTGQVIVAESPLQDGRHALFVEASDQPANPSERRFTLAVVTIEVLPVTASDKNDVLPDFIGAPYEFWVGANVGIGTSVGQVRVTEAVDRYRVIYDLLHSYKDGVPFAIEERSGTITVVDEISKFEPTVYNFEAVVTDGLDSALVTNVTVHVVDPEHDRTPGRGTLEFRVRENVSGAVVGRLGAEDGGDGGGNSTEAARRKAVKYTIANQQDVVDRFSVSQDGAVYTQQGLDREVQDLYRITVVAESTRPGSKGTGVFQVNVLVEDENDNPPVFDHPSYEGTIEENSPPGTEVILNNPIHASDADLGPNAEFTYTLHGEGSDLFSIDPSSGRVLFKRDILAELDREDKAVYVLRVVARDRGSLSNEAKLTINVEDVNDNPPTFLQMVVLNDEDVHVTNDQLPQGTRAAARIDRYTPPLVMISENTPVGTPILRLLATDLDAGMNAVVTYNITSETYVPVKIKTSFKQFPKNFFTIHQNTGEIAISKTLPPETEFRLNVTVKDGGELTDVVTVRIYVKDINDHAPFFKKSGYNFDLPEGTYKDMVLGTIEASDDDSGPNANLSYSLLTVGDQGDVEELPFTISEYSGVLRAVGEIDREEKDTYSFRVIAMDHGDETQHRTTVDVHVHVLDENDNAPEFFGYDRLTKVTSKTEKNADNKPVTFLMPIYYTVIAENVPIGTTVGRVHANDSDFAGNGNGLIIYDISRVQGREEVFAVDSKEGFVTTIGKLDFETQSVHNVSIIASDLGNPSLTSTALLIVNVIDVQEEPSDIERPVFAHRYYEVEVEENVEVPYMLLTLNVTEPYQKHTLRYGLVPSSDSGMFKIDARNGTVFLTKSPDREAKSRHEFKVRVEKMKRGRGVAMIYPMSKEKLVDVAANEVKVIVRVKDINDNPPRFTVHGRPIIAAIPTTASYGYEIVRLQATDPDEGVNADLRYHILEQYEEESRKFAVDSMTGQVRSVVNFAREAGKVYGFDVKATDRRGADDGRSAIANIFVYVLDEQKQLVMLVDSKPMIVERNMANITNTLQNLTGLDVRVRKLEPHHENDLEQGGTDMFLYAVDPQMNVIVDMDTFQHIMLAKQTDIKRTLKPYKVVGIGNGLPTAVKPRTQRYLLSSLEVGVVVLGCVVFVGALAAAICVGCVRRGKHRRKRHANDYQPHMGFTIAAPGHAPKNGLFPYLDQYGDANESYGEESSQYKAARAHKHDPSCSRHHGRGAGRRRHETTSLHSSSKDSGIAERARCVCGHSTSLSSGNSSNGSFEDSLKSLRQKEGGLILHPSHIGRRPKLPPSRRRQRHAPPTDNCLPPPPPVGLPVLVAASATSINRRPSQRIMIDEFL